jgi:3-methyladenine DNA glycosylase AlkD
MPWTRTSGCGARPSWRSSSTVQAPTSTCSSDVLDANLEGSLHGKDFFIRKAVGWALRQHARVDPDWVRAYVDSRGDHLSGLSRREALKHL